MKVLFLLVLITLTYSGDFVDYLNAGFDFRMKTQLASPLFKFTYDQKKDYVIPSRKELGTYKIPDQVTIVDAISHHEHSLVGMYYTYSAFLHEVITSWYFHFGIDVGLFAIGVDINHEEGHVREMVKYNLSVNTMSEIQYTLFRMQLFPPNLIPKSDQFKMFMDNLPTAIKTEKDVKILKEFIVKYGTHFSTGGLFGGKTHFDVSLKEDYLKKKSIDWVKTQVELYFRYKMFSLSPGIFVNKSQIHVDEEFKKNCETKEFFIGGFIKYQTESTLNEWYNSIAENPQLVNQISLFPITDLILDEKKKNVLENAVDQYVRTGDVKPTSIKKKIDVN